MGECISNLYMIAKAAIVEELRDGEMYFKVA